MCCGIYCIENKINHKKYVGQSIDIKSRWRQHKNSSLTRDTFLYRAINKYGIENFEFSILEECTEKELDTKEMYWIDFLDTYNHGYNMTLGGSGVSGYKSYNRNCIPPNFELLAKDIVDIVPIVKLDTDFEILDFYISVQECARANNVESTNISKTASGKHKTCNGYIYLYFNDIKDMTTDEIISFRQKQRESYNFSTNASSTPQKVNLLNSLGELFKTYESIAAAAKDLNIDPSSISKVCRGRLKQTHGYIFEYALSGNTSV